MILLGFDIGGTKSAVVLANVKEKAAEEKTADETAGSTGDTDRTEAGTEIGFLGRKQISTHPGWEQVLDALITGARELAEAHRPLLIENGGIAGAGVACGGPLSPDRKYILSPPNLPGWNQVPVTEYLSKRLGIPVCMENDADAGALAEWRFGAGRGCDNMVFLTFGTGLGAGLILNGRLYRGSCGMAGEIGHVRMEASGPVGYGKAGSLEGFCSGGGIERLAGISGIQKNAGELAAMAEAGDERAKEIYACSGSVFGKGLSIIIDLLNPERIVAGSVYARSRHLLEESMYREIRKEALFANRKACCIVPAELGEQIGDYAAVAAAGLFSGNLNDNR